MAVTARQIIELGVSILLPPLAVFIHGGCTIHVLVSIFFCILAWVPAVVHAIWYCFFRTIVYHHPVQQQPAVVVTSGRPI